MPVDLDALRKDIVFDTQLRGHALRFHSTWGLFSPREIDEGSRLLLDRVVIEASDDCLDLGCGYGPIGLTLATLANQGNTLLVDKDFVAVKYTKKNIEVNHVQNASVLMSNGFDQIPQDMHFDVIISNIPAKVGKELLTLWLHDAQSRLKPGGRFYVVTINGLRQFMKRYMSEIFGNYEKIKQGKSYTVALARKLSN
ncbi:MAG: methyltransferase domain-containing protein [Gammaproteobacteria bacterium]|nr:MAG: methyltransferase domain-containing protein [Gammaproteobacteria bacterium]